MNEKETFLILVALLTVLKRKGIVNDAELAEEARLIKNS